MMKKWSMLMSALLLGAVAVRAGTLIMKDGSSISDVNLVSIEDGKITIEKDKTRKTIAIGRIKGYYHTDIKGGGGLEADVSDYKVMISKIDMPDYGPKKKGGKKSDENCVIHYRITRTGDKSTLPRVKAPYFYVYILLSGDNEYGERGVKFFCYPKLAKPKSSNKGYDRAAILALLGNFDRPIIHMDHVDNQFSDRKATIALKGLPHRKIIAYHVEVYGNSEMILEKDEREPGARVSSKSQWWKNL